MCARRPIYTQSSLVKPWSVAAVVAVLALAGWTNPTTAEDAKTDSARPADPANPAGPTIVDVAKDDPNLKTLVKLLGEGELIDTLNGSRSYTVFAPTDEAFAKLPKEELEALQKPENRAKLQRILRNHVVAGKLMAADVAKVKSIKTMAGEVAVTVTDGKVKLGQANVTKSDIAASNGVIHVIDAVMLPADKPVREPASPAPTAPRQP